jgi:hypothetical protein
MTWYYERDEANNRIRLRFEADDGSVYGPRDVSWPNAPGYDISPDGWVTEPDVKAEAGRASTDFYVDVDPATALMGLRDLAAGIVEEGNPE